MRILFLLLVLIFSCVKEPLKQDKNTLQTSIIIEEEKEKVFDIAYKILTEEYKYPIKFFDKNFGIISTEWIGNNFEIFEINLSVRKINNDVFVSINKHVKVSEDGKIFKVVVSDRILENKIINTIKKKLGQ
jgi:hypothetical protein